MRMLMAVLLVSLVGLAGCFGSNSQAASYDCREVPVHFFITGADDGSVPVYELNDGERQMRVVAMGFQLGGNGVEPDPSNGETGLVVPNPEIRVKECDTVVLTIENTNPLSHTFHLHGGLQEWTHDGVPFLSQLPVHQNQEFTYRFEDLKAGTYWYHCHVDVAHHIDLGMYGAFIVEEREPVYDVEEDIYLMLDEWDNCHIHGGYDPTQSRESAGSYPLGDLDCEGRTFQDYYGMGPLQGQNQVICNDPTIPQQIKDQVGCGHGDPGTNRDERQWYPADFPVYAPEYNTFTINGKAFPDTQPIYFEEGKSYRIRLINVGEEWHAMHLHGHSFLIAYRDGYRIEHPQRADTISVGPGERFDIIVEADNPGFWAFHDHVGLNVMNDHQAPGGMFTLVAYTGQFAEDVGFDPSTVERAIDIMDFTRAYHEEHGAHGGHQVLRNTLPMAKPTIGTDPLGNVRYAYS